jgi:hypothetical protein
MISPMTRTPSWGVVVTIITTVAISISCGGQETGSSGGGSAGSAGSAGSGGSGGGGGSAGSGGSAGRADSAGGAGSTGSGGAAGSGGSAGSSVSCFETMTTGGGQCLFVVDTSHGFTCPINTEPGSCPSSGVVGCCVMPQPGSHTETNGICYYQASQISSGKDTCATKSGSSWSATVP